MSNLVNVLFFLKYIKLKARFTLLFHFERYILKKTMHIYYEHIQLAKRRDYEMLV